MADADSLVLTRQDPGNQWFAVTPPGQQASLSGVWVPMTAAMQALEITTTQTGAPLEADTDYWLHLREGTAQAPTSAVVGIRPFRSNPLEVDAPGGEGTSPETGGYAVPRDPENTEDVTWEFIFTKYEQEPALNNPHWTDDRTAIDQDSDGDPFVGGQKYYMWYRAVGTLEIEHEPVSYKHDAEGREPKNGDTLDQVLARNNSSRRTARLGGLSIRKVNGTDVLRFLADADNNAEIKNLLGGGSIWLYGGGGIALTGPGGLTVDKDFVEFRQSVFIDNNFNKGVFMRSAAQQLQAAFEYIQGIVRMANGLGHTAGLWTDGVFRIEGGQALRDASVQPNPAGAFVYDEVNGFHETRRMTRNQFAAWINPALNAPGEVEVFTLPDWLSAVGLSTAGSTDRTIHAKATANDPQVQVFRQAANVQPKGGLGAEEWEAHVWLDMTTQFASTPNYSHRRPLNSRAGVEGLLGGVQYRFRFRRASNPQQVFVVDSTIPLTDTNGIVSIVSASANQAPVVNGTIPPQFAYVGQRYSLIISETLITDPEGATLTRTLTRQDGTAIPSYMSFTPGTRNLVVEAANLPSPGTSVALRYRCTDPGSLSAFVDFLWSVFQQNSQTAQVVSLEWEKVGGKLYFYINMSPDDAGAEYSYKGLEDEHFYTQADNAPQDGRPAGNGNKFFAVAGNPVGQRKVAVRPTSNRPAVVDITVTIPAGDFARAQLYPEPGQTDPSLDGTSFNGTAFTTLKAPNKAAFSIGTAPDPNYFAWNFPEQAAPAVFLAGRVPTFNLTKKRLLLSCPTYQTQSWNRTVEKGGLIVRDKLAQGASRENTHFIIDNQLYEHAANLSRNTGLPFEQRVDLAYFAGGFGYEITGNNPPPSDLGLGPLLYHGIYPSRADSIRTLARSVAGQWDGDSLVSSKYLMINIESAGTRDGEDYYTGVARFFGGIMKEFNQWIKDVKGGNVYDHVCWNTYGFPCWPIFLHSAALGYSNPNAQGFPQYYFLTPVGLQNADARLALREAKGFWSVDTYLRATWRGPFYVRASDGRVQTSGGQPVWVWEPSEFQQAGRTWPLARGENRHLAHEIYRQYGAAMAVLFYLNGGQYPTHTTSRAAEFVGTGLSFWERHNTETFSGGAYIQDNWGIDFGQTDRPNAGWLIRGQASLKMLLGDEYVAWDFPTSRSSMPGTFRVDALTEAPEYVQYSDGVYEQIIDAAYRVSLAQKMFNAEGEWVFYCHPYRSRNEAPGDHFHEKPLPIGKLFTDPDTGKRCYGEVRWWPVYWEGETSTQRVFFRKSDGASSLAYRIDLQGRERAIWAIELPAGFENISARDCYDAFTDMGGAARIRRGDLRETVPAGLTVPPDFSTPQP